ncbi:MAG: hypothetical protein ABW003_18480, partial [Microvirga sp.]
MEPQREELVGRVRLTAAVMALPVTRIVLDGEAAAHCSKGLPDFNALLRRTCCATACFYAFDLLLVGAEDLRGFTLVERRALLREHLKHTGAARPEAQESANVQGTRLAGAIARMQGTFQSGMLALHKMRSGGQQTVRVVHQHVNVSDGAQAVVAGEMNTGQPTRGEGSGPEGRVPKMSKA